MAGPSDIKMLKFVCSSDEFDVVETVLAETPELAAEEYVNNNLEFNPSDPQDSVEVEVREEGKILPTDHVLVDVSIEIEWTAKAQAM